MTRYVLLADPRTGKVVRRSRELLPLESRGLVPLLVTKGIWKTYRADDLVCATDLPVEVMDHWLRRRREVAHLDALTADFVDGRRQP